MNLKYSEQELIAGLQNRDKDFFAYLYDRYAGALNGIICKMVKDPKISNEVLQKTYIKVWYLFKSYNNNKERLFTWMVQIARLQTVDSIRNNTNNSNSLTSNAANDFMNTDDTANQSYSLTITKQVSSFEINSKEILDLAYFQNFSPEEISKKLGLSLETIKTKLRMAVKEIGFDSTSQLEMPDSIIQ